MKLRIQSSKNGSHKRSIILIPKLKAALLNQEMEKNTEKQQTENC